MDETEPFLTAELRAALRPQRPPDRFAEAVLGRVAGLRDDRRRRRTRLFVAAALAPALAAAAAFALLPSRAPRRGEIVASAAQDAHLGPRVVAALRPGAHVAWDGDLVTQVAGDVFYRVEPGGPARVRTPGGDVTVRGTCFDVKVRGGEEEGANMIRRGVKAGVIGAAVGAAVLVGVYEGKVTLSRAATSVDLVSGQAGRADRGGVHGPESLAGAGRAFEAAAGEEPWREANQNMADQLALLRRRLDANDAEKKAIERELRDLKAKEAAGGREGGAPRDILKVDPRDLTPDDLKELAKKGMVRTRFYCPPPGDWHVTPDQLTSLGLAPTDAPAVEHAVAATQAQMWSVVGPECAKLVGLELATRLGAEMCGLILQTALPKDQAKQSIQLVADVLAGNRPLPEGPLDPLAGRILAQTQQTAVFEGDLAAALGPEAARRVARSDALDLECGMEFAP